MNTILCLAALVAISLALGIRIGLGLYTRALRSMHKRNVEICVEDRDAQTIAIVISMPKENRVLAEELVERMRKS